MIFFPKGMVYDGRLELFSVASQSHYGIGKLRLGGHLGKKFTKKNDSNKKRHTNKLHLERLQSTERLPLSAMGFELVLEYIYLVSPIHPLHTGDLDTNVSLLINTLWS